MPYIKNSDRGQYQQFIDQLASIVPMDPLSRPGHMNFIITSLIKKVYGKNMRYADHNEVLGFLQGVSLEFYRRQTAPYEDKKIESEGDV